MVTNLIAAITGSPVTGGITKDATTAISNDLNNNGAFGSFADPHKNTTDDKPRAYLTVLYFDERFNFVSEGSTFDRTDQDGNDADPLTITSKAPKNGYAYIYVSNENNDPVYFDNLIISHNRGRIIEENHYYAFGLKIAGISSRKLGDENEGALVNRYLYNDKELIEEGDLGWYDYGFRNYDPQIGRFPQLDPLTDDYPYYTPYQYAGNEPIANIDIDGLEPGSSITVNVIGNAATSGTYNVIVRAAPRVAQAGANAGGIVSKSLSMASIGVNAAKLSLTAISLRGTKDAMLNASSVGIYDRWGGNHLNEYKTPVEQQAYLNGRLIGDATATAMGTSEMEVGGGIALTTGIETVGVGAAAGGVLALHGAASAGVATADAAKTLTQLYQLNMASQGANDVSAHYPNSSNTTKSSTTKSSKQLLKEAQLPSSGKIRFIPRPEDVKSGNLLRKQGGFMDKFGNIWKKGPSRTAGENFEWDVQLSQTGKNQVGWLSRDGKHLNVSLKGIVTH